MRPKSGNQSEKPKKGGKRQKLPKECEVCGQQSRFKYYNVQSCESCKQFFRRIVLKQKEFHCLKFWTCDFSKGERCRGCRFDKCLRLGMDPAMVNVQMTERLKEFIGVLEKRRKKLLDPHYSKFKIDPEPGSVEEMPHSLADGDSDGHEEVVEGEIRASASDSPAAALASFGPFGQGATGIARPEGASPRTLPMVQSAQKLELALPHQQKQMSPWVCSPVPLSTLPSHVESLLLIEQKIRKIHYSFTELAPDYFDKYTDLGDLLQRMDNLLANSRQFSAQQTPHWIRPENLEKAGFWAGKPVYYIRDLLLVVDFARTIPVYSQLPVEDQITLISSFSLSASRMMISFYSLERNAQTMLLPNGMPIAEKLRVGPLSKDPILETLSRKVYNLPVSAFQRVSPSKEEFILLLTLLFLNSAVSGLSPHAQLLLKEEAEKYGNALLRLQQRMLGNQAGALRYMETMSLLWNSNANSYKYRDLLAYLDAFYEQGQFERVMPKTLAALCMQGPELATLPNQL